MKLQTISLFLAATAVHLAVADHGKGQGGDGSVKAANQAKRLARQQERAARNEELRADIKAERYETNQIERQAARDEKLDANAEQKATTKEVKRYGRQQKYEARKAAQEAKKAAKGQGGENEEEEFERGYFYPGDYPPAKEFECITNNAKIYPLQWYIIIDLDEEGGKEALAFRLEEVPDLGHEISIEFSITKSWLESGEIRYDTGVYGDVAYGNNPGVVIDFSKGFVENFYKEKVYPDFYMPLDEYFDEAADPYAYAMPAITGSLTNVQIIKVGDRANGIAPDQYVDVTEDWYVRDSVPQCAMLPYL